MIKMDDVTSITPFGDDPDTGLKHTQIRLQNHDKYCSCGHHNLNVYYIGDVDFIRTNQNGHSYVVFKTGERFCTCGAHTYQYKDRWPDWVEIFGND